MNKNRLLNDIIDHMEDGCYFVDPMRKITAWNKSAERITGYTAKEVIGSRCQDNLLSHIDNEGRPLCLTGCPLFDTMGDGIFRMAEVILRHKDGHRITVQVKVFPIYEKNGSICGAVEIFTPRRILKTDSRLFDDLTDRIMTDRLTGLPNRDYIEGFFNFKKEELTRFGKNFCVVFLDVDNFGHFNDHYGHDVGDRILKAISGSFKSSLRSSDTMGRWGGEEFVGVFSLDSAEEACLIAEKIRVLVISSEVMHKRSRINVTASLGVAIAKENDNIHSIVDRADKLMYMSKKRTKNCYTVENPDGGLIEGPPQ